MIFCPFLTYLPTLTFPITSNFGGYFGPPSYLISDIINGCSLMLNIYILVVAHCRWGLGTPWVKILYRIWVMPLMWCGMHCGIGRKPHYLLIVVPNGHMGDMWSRTRNPSIYNIIRWFAGQMWQTTLQPCVWCSKNYSFFFIKSCKILSKNPFNLFFIFFMNLQKWK